MNASHFVILNNLLFKNKNEKKSIYINLNKETM